MSDLRLSFEIEGERQLSRRLVGISEGMKNWSQEFDLTGRLLVSKFRENFVTQGSTLNAPWSPLKPATIVQKRRLGYPATPLIRTGAMFRNFKFRIGRLFVVVWNPTIYFAYHQSNRPRRRLPRRIMMKLTENLKQEIVKIFQNGIQNKLRNRRATL